MDIDHFDIGIIPHQRHGQAPFKSMKAAYGAAKGSVKDALRRFFFFRSGKKAHDELAAGAHHLGKARKDRFIFIGVMEHVCDVEASPLQNVTEAGVNTKPQLAVGVTVMHVLGYAGRLLTEIL